MKEANIRKIGMCVVLLLVSIITLFARSEGEIAASIIGKVLTADGKPAQNVSVIIKSIHKTTLSDDDGYFKFRHIATGNYEIEISLIGV